MRVLVVKTTSRGDVVHTLPAVTDMARAVPDIEIDWLVEKPFAAIPSLHPAVRRVLPIAWRKWRHRLASRETWQAMAAVRKQLRAARYDLVIDFQGLLKSALWAVQALAPVAGYDRASAKEPLAAALYQRRATVDRSLHAVDRSRRLAAAHLAYALPATAPDFGLAAPAPAWTPPEPCAVLIPCASRPEKLWPEDRWRAIVARCERRALVPVLMWGSADEERLARRIAEATTAVVPPFLTVADTAAVLARARLVVGLDTGFTHLGAAYGRPAVGIYCDHEPGLAGLTGPGYVQSLGGKGQVPGLEAVEQAFDEALLHAD